MAERYFLSLLAIFVVLGSFWLAFVEPAPASKIVVAALLGLLGLVSIVNAGSVKAGVIMPLFFAASIAYAVYIYVSNPVIGYLLASISVLSVVGLVVSLGISRRPVKAVAMPSSKAVKPASAGRSAGSKRSGSSGRRGRKRKA